MQRLRIYFYTMKIPKVLSAHINKYGNTYAVINNHINLSAFKTQINNLFEPEH